MLDSRHISIDHFPSWKDAPEELRKLDDNCGPLSMWMVAKALGRDLDTNTIVTACHFKSDGVWPTRLALAFQELGFKVEYRAHSVVAEEPDLHAEAKTKQLPILPPMLLSDLLKHPAITIICYDVVEGGAHFTPALPMTNDCVDNFTHFPYYPK
jgi:hypothetical protein